VVTHNDDTAAVNQFISANGWDDSHASAPQLSVTVTAGSEDVSVGSVTAAGYDSQGQEIGSTDVGIGQVITAGQSMTFTGGLPWYQVSEYDSYGNPTVHSRGVRLPGGLLGLRLSPRENTMYWCREAESWQGT
jgi:hypothetical protein